MRANAISYALKFFFGRRFSVACAIEHASRIIANKSRVAGFARNDMQMKVRYRLACKFFLIPCTIESFCVECFAEYLHNPHCHLEESGSLFLRELLKCLYTTKGSDKRMSFSNGDIGEKGPNVFIPEASPLANLRK